MLLGQQGYNFEAQPRAVHPNTKYRDEQGRATTDKERYHNLMFDRRVVRGNTHSSNMVRLLPSEDAYAQNMRGQNTGTGYNTGNKATTNQNSNNVNTYSMTGQMVMTPRDLEGYNSMSTMTEEYIEVLSDKPEQREQESQTDFLLNKPAVENSVDSSSKYIFRLNNNDKKSISTQIVEED